MPADAERRFAALALAPPGSPLREDLLLAYKKRFQETRASKRRKHKMVILEGVRKRPPRLLLKQATTAALHSHAYAIDSQSERVEKPESSEEPSRGGNVFTKFLAEHFGVGSSTERPEGWAAAKINRSMRKYYMMQLLTAKRASQHLALQSKLLFDECCQCRPLVLGPSKSESGVLRLAEPNLPKILRILRSEANNGLDLLLPHGLDQYTVMHVAAQRGYLDLVRELLLYWNTHPMDSPYQTYSFLLVSHLLELILQQRKTKTLVSEAHAEMRAIVAEVGVEFARFSDALDKLNDDAITLADLLVICGHPLVLAKDAAGNTPLHYAAEGGHLSLCQLLIANGANIDAQNKAGETPLHFAISSQRHGVCIYLVENNADVRISRYVSITLLNDTVLRGTFVDYPDASDTAKIMPSLHYRSGALVAHMHTAHGHAGGKAQPKKGPSSSNAISPDMSPDKTRARARHEAAGGAHDTTCTRVDTLLASPFLSQRNPRDVAFFRPAPGSSLLSSKILCVLVTSEHVAASELAKARELHQKTKLFHLLIENMPEAAVVAMDSFRKPLFRCSMLRHVREHNQRWTVDNDLKTEEERIEALLLKMKAPPVVSRMQRRNRKRGTLLRGLHVVWTVLVKIWRVLRHVRRVLSIQNMFAATEAAESHKESIVCEPKGILYEYMYDHAEFRGNLSPTLALIVKTECKELMSHKWVGHILDHKWNSFARQTFRSEFHVYFVYFMAVFIATYLHVGDTYIGMTLGGYRNNIFTERVGIVEYIRDLARLVYSGINAHYTLQEFRTYRECGSLRRYLRDGWNWFDIVQITCVWLLLFAEVLEMVVPDMFDTDDYRLIVYQESLYSFSIQRKYNFRITLMSIVGPQIFIKWIQFARGTKVLGPFVRMLAKMFSDILVFVLVFCVFLCGFAFAFFILQLDGCKSYASALTTAFEISLGSWNWDSIYKGGPLAIFFFVGFVVIGTIMLLNLLIAMLANTYDKIWGDHLFFYELERAKATLSIQTSLDGDLYDEKYWCHRLYTLEGDTPIEGIQFQRF